MGEEEDDQERDGWMTWCGIWQWWE